MDQHKSEKILGLQGLRKPLYLHEFQLQKPYQFLLISEEPSKKDLVVMAREGQA